MASYFLMCNINYARKVAGMKTYINVAGIDVVILTVGASTNGLQHNAVVII